MTRGAAIVAAVVVLAAGARVLLGPYGGDAPGPAPATRAPAPDRRGTAAVVEPGGALPERAPTVPRRPRSLAGTRPDGGLEVDARGALRPSAETRRLFDYYLTASGEEAAETIRARIVARLTRQLQPAAAAEATALLDRYLTYRARARALADAGLDAAPLQARLDALSALRREVLGVADAEALFGIEEARDRAALARLAALADPALGPEERARALADAAAGLPEPARRAEEAATLPLRLSADEASLRAAGGSQDDLRRLRETAVGPEAAARLAALDRERAEWQARLEEYRAARAAIDADAARSEAERDRARAALLAERFSPPERLRVEALERGPAER